MNLKQVHDMVKENYEHGAYSRPNYSYKANDSHDINNTSDFQMGRDQARDDYRNGKLKFYPRPLLKLLNLIFRQRMREVVDFATGYNLSLIHI